MKIELIKLSALPWGDDASGEIRCVSFDLIDIKKAIEEKRFDKRNYQDDRDKIYYGRNLNYEEWFTKFTKYHIERIAYLVASGLWKYPIIIRPDYSIEDGQHRYWAAKYLGESEIEVFT